MNSYQIIVKGVVQGVGFRPFIFNLAEQLKINGNVSNDSLGVTINVTTSKEMLDLFTTHISLKKPPLSKIDSIDVKDVAYKEYEKFEIIQSQRSISGFTIMPSDISICEECEKELNDKSNRRFAYPFITCTNCGPRYTIIETLPYDRKNTSMGEFKMCIDCQKEYEDPHDRRYHAQPIGCHKCGPEISLFNTIGEIVNCENIISKAVELLLSGAILAIKGVGGYHLVCDATQTRAVKLLRDRKQRADKPFAVMVKDIESAKKLAKISKKEEELLTSIARPIVLLEKKGDLDSHISPLVAPSLSKIGLFLPYTPLHLLLLQKLNRSLVATSANVSDEPLCTNFEEIKKLSTVWDYCLDHNRTIVNGCDDSVLTVVEDRTLFFRRSRGFAPKSIKLPFKLKERVLSVGANQKSTIAIGFEENVILSPHIGDLNTLKSIEYFRENIENLKRIYDFVPDVVMCDFHPNYESSKYAQNFNFKKVQHHHAHILAVMAEKKINQKVLGISFDGTGFGDDGHLWGGEFLLCDRNSYERVAHIKYFKLLGGERAIKEPRRVALSLLFDIYGEEALTLNHPTINSFTSFELKSLFTAWNKNLNAPLSSSVGRLFDAVASLCDIIQVISYEGQSGAMMESYYDDSIFEFYSFSLDENIIDISSLIEEILKDDDKIVIISKFFNTIVEIIYCITQKYDFPVVLSGGVFQNSVLLKLVLKKNPDAIISSEVPPNDGAIALGQIMKG